MTLQIFEKDIKNDLDQVLIVLFRLSLFETKLSYVYRNNRTTRKDKSN